MKAEPEIVSGWAIGENPEEPVRLALLLNGKEVAQTIANKLRPGLKEKGLHPTGECGFVFRFKADKCLQVGDQVKIKPINSEFLIRNSPCIVSAVINNAR